MPEATRSNVHGHIHGKSPLYTFVTTFVRLGGKN